LNRHCSVSHAGAKKLFRNEDTMLREGYIALQAESHPLDFRKVDLMPLEE
jgi:hypothetical protein